MARVIRAAGSRTTTLHMCGMCSDARGLRNSRDDLSDFQPCPIPNLRRSTKPSPQSGRRQLRQVGACCDFRGKKMCRCGDQRRRNLLVRRTCRYAGSPINRRRRTVLGSVSARTSPSAPLDRSRHAKDSGRSLDSCRARRDTSLAPSLYRFGKRFCKNLSVCSSRSESACEG